MHRFGKLRIFAFSCGLVLFLIGLGGFAFRNGRSIPDWHLFIDIVLGFWGLLISFGSTKK